MNVLAEYWDLTKPWRGGSALAVVLGGVAALLEGAALGMLLPVLSDTGGAHFLFSRVLGDQTPADLRPLALGIFVVLALASAGVRMWTEIILLRLKTDIETATRTSMMDALLSMEWPRFAHLKQGDLGKAITMEGLQIGIGAQHAISAVSAALAALSYLFIAVLISPALAAITVAFGALCVGLYLLGASRVKHAADQLSVVSGQIGDSAASVFGNLKFFRSAGLVREARERSVALFQRFANAYFTSHAYPHLLRGAIESLAGVFVAVFLVFQIWGMQGSPASALIFLGLFFRMTPRLFNLQSHYYHAKIYLTWKQSHDQRMSLASSAQERDDGSLEADFREQINFRDIHFTYPGAANPALAGISTSIYRGEFIGIVGASGSGKSTLCDLVTGLIRPQQGDIQIDGTNLRDIQLDRWRRGLGVVMQDAVLINDTIERNVSLGSPHPDPARVERALRNAHAWDFVSALHDGVRTMVADRGASLSGGQRQRLAIARALYRDPALLILDEATSALDSEAEREVQKALEQMRGSLTILAIAHRLQTVMSADRILVFKAGRLAESGPWKQLIESKGELFRLASLQELA